MNDIDYKMSGEKMKKRRKEIGLTQEAVAERINLSPSYYSHVENGSRKAGLQTMIKIAACLNVTLDYIMGEDHSDNINVQIEQLMHRAKRLNEKQIDFVITVIDAMQDVIE